MYDYTCPYCTHEFDYGEGVVYDNISGDYIECPHCYTTIEILDEDEKTHNNS